MKGIVIIAFDDDFKITIDTQFPSNLTEFMKLDEKSLNRLAEVHIQNKMEPHFLEVDLDDGLNIASFYSGFSFKHYVGKPKFAVTVFISEGDILPKDFEGMIRRIAHELLPKRDALNFDDILGQYYDMLKNEELTPYWEEIIEGETSQVKRKEKEEKGEKEEEKSQETKEEINIEEPTEKKEDLVIEKELEQKDKEIQDLQELLTEKKGKIRELTKKYTDLTAENSSLKEEVSEQFTVLRTAPIVSSVCAAISYYPQSLCLTIISGTILSALRRIPFYTSWSW